MSRATLIAVLSLLYLQWGHTVTLIPEGKEFVYSYSGVVTANNSGSDVFASEWSIHGKLVMQSYGNDIVMKFKDIKSSLFNGIRDNLETAQEKPIPEEAHHMYLPFVVHYRDDGLVSSLSHQPDDPVWSVNMKKAIGSIMQVTEQVSTNKLHELNIYGNCEPEYSIDKTNSVKTITKTLNNERCGNDLERSWSSCARAPAMPKDFNPTNTAVVRTYRFVHKNDANLLEHIESHANITYQTMPSERSSQQLIQRQIFHLEATSVITEPIGRSKITESASMDYIFNDDDETNGRRKKETIDSEKLLKDLKEYYEQFKTEFHKYPLQVGDIGINNTLQSMFITLSKMDEDTIDLTALGVLFSDDEEVQNIFVSMLPYIGTNETTKLIKEALESDGLNDLIAIKIMAIFPKYVNQYTPELLKNMEVLQNLKAAENKQVRYAGVLCFAAMVAEANTRADIPMKQLEKYYTQYSGHFEDSENYEDKMTFLLGLINMGSILDADIMISMITDDQLSHHLRSLATYGFKPFLIANEGKLFETLWPLVLNQKQHFELRVAILDLLLSANLTQEQFDTIIAECRKPLSDMISQHMQNYLVSTLHSISNQTMYSDYLGAMAAATLEGEPIQNLDSAWATGNYRLSYTDAIPNFGGYVQVRSVATPLTNLPSVIQLSYNQFAMSMNLGTYTAYIKLDGVADLMFVKGFLKDRPLFDVGIPELVNMLKSLNFKMSDFPKIHAEIVLFCNDRAVFGMHVNKDNIYKYSENPLFVDLMKLIVDYEYVTYPKMYWGDLRSDLGTPVRTSVVETEVVSYTLKTDMDKLFDDATEMKTGEWNYRSTRFEVVELESYNPLIDVNIGVNKYLSFGQRLNISLAFNTTGDYLIFDNNDDLLNLVVDRTIHTTVDNETKLIEYCASCSEYTNFLLHEPRMSFNDAGIFGIALNVTREPMRPFSDNPLDLKLFDAYRRNAKVMPVAELFLLHLYAGDYKRYLGSSDVEGATINLHTYREEPTETLVEFDFDLDDMYNEKDPINGTTLYFTMKLTTRKKHDATAVHTIDVQYSYSDGAVSTDKNTASHIEQKHKLRADYVGLMGHYNMCFDREFKYPSRNSDLWSISPVDAAKGKGHFSAGSTGKTGECSDDFVISFSDVFETSDDIVDQIKEEEEYKKCKKASAGYKYTPAVVSCELTHDAMSKYYNYSLYVDLHKAGTFSKIDAALRTSDRGFKLLQVNYLQDGLVDVHISKEFLRSLPVQITLDDFADFNTSVGIFDGTEDPTTVAYGRYDTKIGLSSTCDITLEDIFTFTDKVYENYHSKYGNETVAYIETFPESYSAMTIQKFEGKKIGFTMWSGYNKLVTSVSGDKLKVVLNGKQLSSQYGNDEYFKVYFLENDVIYVTNQIVEVYYNTEYISIKAPVVYNRFIGGLCAHDNRMIRPTDKDNEVK